MITRKSPFNQPVGSPTRETAPTRPGRSLIAVLRRPAPSRAVPHRAVPRRPAPRRPAPRRPAPSRAAPSRAAPRRRDPARPGARARSRAAAAGAGRLVDFADDVVKIDQLPRWVGISLATGVRNPPSRDRAAPGRTRPLDGRPLLFSVRGVRRPCARVAARPLPRQPPQSTGGAPARQPFASSRPLRTPDTTLTV